MNRQDDGKVQKREEGKRFTILITGGRKTVDLQFTQMCEIAILLMTGVCVCAYGVDYLSLPFLKNV